jgi:hypothetical protein
MIYVQGWKLRDNAARLTRLQETQTSVKDKLWEQDSWQPSKPYGGNTWKERIRGALLLLFNKADYVRWF